MHVYPGSSLAITITTRLLTGGSQDPSAISAVMKRNAVATAEPVVIADIGLGESSALFTIPAGWSGGDTVEILATATVGGITESEVVWRETLAAIPGAPGVVSGVTLYAASTDVEFIWSEFGVMSRLDDDFNGSADDGLMDLGLQKASLDVNRYLIQRYTVPVIAASSWARWATAYIAAVAIGRRRGLSIPEGLVAEAQQYRDAMQAIKDGTDHLPSDTGLATPRFDGRPSMSNLTVDLRGGWWYGRSKVRRVAATSTGPDQAPGLRRNNEQPLGW